MPNVTVDRDAEQDIVDPPIDELPPEEDDGDDDDAGRWITVATFWQPMDAHMARIKLESMDIDCVLLDEYLVATDWLYANAVGGIKLQVHEERVAEAQEALERRGDGGSSDALADPDDGDSDGVIRYASIDVTCPECGSTNVHRQRWTARSVFLAILLLGFPLPFISRKWECEACGHEWEPTVG